MPHTFGSSKTVAVPFWRAAPIALTCALLAWPSLAGPSYAAVSESAAPAATPVIGLQLVASSLGSVTSITNIGDARLFLTILSGRIVIYSNGIVSPTPFLDVSSFISCCGERGLLSVSFHPQYASNGLFFIYTTNTAGDIEITRYHRSVSDPNQADPASRVVLLTIPHPTNGNHNGGQLQFGPDDYLYIGTGDGGSGDDPPCNAQNDDSPLGKMLRIDVDQNMNTAPFYGIPASNPMAIQAYPRNLTWAKGLRNPFRFSFDRSTGDLWIGDVGQGAWEEVDFQPHTSAGGENYGWKIMEGNHCGAGGNTNCPTSPAPPVCNSPLFTDPVFEYAHGTGDCAVIGGYVYRGTIDPTLGGSYIYGDLCSGRLWVSGQLQAPTAGGLQTFGEGAGGELYAATGGGSLYLVTHPNVPAITSLTASPTLPQPFGVPITWTATATGVAPLQYRFWEYNSATGVQTMVRDYSTTNTFSWTPTVSNVGDHRIIVWVRSAGSSNPYDAYYVGPAFTITNTTTVTSLIASPSLPRPAGTQIIWTVTATGGVAPLQYRFWEYNSATGAQTMVRDYSTTNTFSWTPTVSNVGDHRIIVWVRSAGSSNPYDIFYIGPTFTITGPSPTVTSLIASPPPPRPAGTQITWTVTATGGVAPLQYRFWEYNSATGAQTMVRDYSTTNTFSWTPTVSNVGDHRIIVWVRNAGSSAPYDTYYIGPTFQVTP